MLEIKNKGVTKTVIRSNGRSKTNRINWDADYDGEVANISLDIEDDGIKNNYSSRLTNDDIAALLTPPQETQMSLEERLLNDFGNDTPQMVFNPKRIAFTPLRIENAQSASSSSLITAPEGGVLNERRCKKASKILFPFSKREVKKRPSTRRSISRRSTSRRSTSRRNSTRRNKKRSLYVRM